MTDLHNYLSSINTVVARHDGGGLALAVSIKTSLSKGMIQLVDRAKTLNPMSYCASNILDQVIAQVIGRRISALIAISSGDWANAYQHQLGSYNAILDYLKEDASSWIIPALTRIMNDLRLLAYHVRITFSQ